MDIGIVSSRYARALLKYATGNGENAEAYNAMNTLCQSYLEIPSFQDALLNPTLSEEKKLTLLGTASGQPGGKCIQDFFKMVIRKKRLEMMLYIAHAYIDLYRKQQNLIQSQLTVASSLDMETTNRLKDLVKKQTECDVEFKIKQDASIIGGFILEYDTYRYDASIRGKLQSIKKDLLAHQ